MAVALRAYGAPGALMPPAHAQAAPADGHGLAALFGAPPPGPGPLAEGGAGGLYEPRPLQDLDLEDALLDFQFLSDESGSCDEIAWLDAFACDPPTGGSPTSRRFDPQQPDLTGLWMGLAPPAQPLVDAGLAPPDVDLMAGLEHFGFAPMEDEEADFEADVRAAVTCSQYYPQLVQTYFQCLALNAGRSLEELDATPVEEARLVAIARAQMGARHPDDVQVDPEVDAFVLAYTHQLADLRDGLAGLAARTDAVCDHLSQQMDALALAAGLAPDWREQVPDQSGIAMVAASPSVSGVGGDGSDDAGGEVTGGVGHGSGSGGGGGVGGGGGADPVPQVSPELRSRLKATFAGSILKLKTEFLKTKKKGKLPDTATSSLKKWWLKHLTWPYPSEADKRALEKATGLNDVQINNWFINQRKRHWHKLFPEGAIPKSAAEAKEAIKKIGLQVFRKATQ